MLLDVDQYKYTHFVVDDIDEAQSIDGLMDAYMKGSAEELAEHRDSYIGTVAVEGAAGRSNSAAVTTADEAKALVDEAFVWLWDNSVKINADVSIVMTPWFYSLFKHKLTELYTNNEKLIKKGVVGMYNNAMVKLSNNLPKSGEDDCIIIRTKDAVAFAHGIENIEPYRPEKQFADAVKVLDTYGAKVVRPNEIYVIRAHKA